MKFAEMTQEVHIARSNPVKLDLGFTPGRRQANKVAALARTIVYNSGMCTRRRLRVSIQILLFF